MRVTIADIAKRAGVSVNTVSRALSGKDGVSEETRAKIVKIARELNYRPNLLGVVCARTGLTSSVSWFWISATPSLAA